MVAVKVFNLQQKGASKSFMDECESMRNIRHRNLLTMVTSCSSMDYAGNDFKALVFEFMPNGSLEKWLHGDTDGQIDQGMKLKLHQRLNIAVDVAYALNYLHHESHVSIIHRDLKPSNVLIDNDMVAHVSDFGLAKLLSISMENLSQNQSISDWLKGSIGYAAPEYGMGSDASTHGDVYSYGILLLELFTKKRPTDAMFIDGLNLHNFAKMALPDQVMGIIDPGLTSTEDLLGKDVEKTNQTLGSDIQSPLECIVAVFRIGVACSVESPGERMNMGEVVKELQLIRDKSSAFFESL